MKYINWSNEIFAGFYESNLYNSDMIANATYGEDAEFDFVDGGYEAFERAVAERCTNELWNNITQPDGEIIRDMQFVAVHSPAYYNFTTDKIEIDVECDFMALEKYVRETHREDFNEYLQNNFTSYDGFISFVPNNVTEFFNELENDFERLSQVMLEFYILHNLDADAYQDACSEIAMETIWEYIAPVKTEETEETK